jgi:hypothetical protein
VLRTKRERGLGRIWGIPRSWSLEHQSQYLLWGYQRLLRVKADLDLAAVH